MLHSSVEEYRFLDNSLIFVSDDKKGHPEGEPQFQDEGEQVEEPLQEDVVNPLIGLDYPMATTMPQAASNSSVFSLSTTSSGPLFGQNSLLDSDFYSTSFLSNRTSFTKTSFDDERNGFIAARDPLMSYTSFTDFTTQSCDKDPSLIYPITSSEEISLKNEPMAIITEQIQSKYNDEESESNYEHHTDEDSEGEHHHIPRQRRYSSRRSTSSPTCSVSASGSKKVSDSRLSAQGLAEVLNLDSAEEALRRERYILDIFENELHYPLGYKTWVRDTSKEYRSKLLNALHERVQVKYPEYDHNVLETVIRRATYYMMQSRLRRERRAKAKLKRDMEKKKDTQSKNEFVTSGNNTSSRGSTSSESIGLKRYSGSSSTSFLM